MKRKLLLTTTVLFIGLFAVALPARAERFGVQLGAANGKGFVRVSYNGGRASKRDGESRHRHNVKTLRPAPRSKSRPVRLDRGRHSRSVVYGRSFRHVPPRRVVHTCARVPVYTKIWVDPVYTTVYDGRDKCGRPRYRSVLVTPGFFRNVVSHYAYTCGGGKCGVDGSRRRH